MRSRRNVLGTSTAIFEACEPRRLLSGSPSAHLADDSLANHTSTKLTQHAIRSGDKAPLFDFSDSFYTRNGIDPTKIAGRPNGTGTSVSASAPDADHRGIRMTGLNGMHDDGGKPNFFAVLGTVKTDAFLNSAAGQAARQIADRYIAYIFPKAGGNPLSPANKREDELIPLNNGYFSNDPTNIWREAFVNYTARSTWSANAQRLANELIGRNGTDTDGTPYLKTINDINDAKREGLVTVSLRADDGSQGAPWFFCAVFKDYNDGAITRDTTLTVVHKADGTVGDGERDIQTLFDQLKANAGNGSNSGSNV